MARDEWSFEANLKRGYLPTGEPLDAMYGPGWWTDEPEPDREPFVIQCHECGSRAYDLGKRIDCESCGIIEAQC